MAKVAFSVHSLTNNIRLMNQCNNVSMPFSHYIDLGHTYLKVYTRLSCRAWNVFSSKVTKKVNVSACILLMCYTFIAHRPYKSESMPVKYIDSETSHLSGYWEFKSSSCWHPLCLQALCGRSAASCRWLCLVSLGHNAGCHGINELLLAYITNQIYIIK